MKPRIRIAHEVGSGEDFRLYPFMPTPFISLMDALYPALVSNSEARRGRWLCAFRADGQFVGAFGGLTLASVRRNPWLPEDGEQWFLRALLAGIHADGHQYHQSRCARVNYGTLRLWKKLGLGAKITARDDCQSEDAEVLGSVDLLDRAIETAKREYGGIRAHAERVIASNKLEPSRYCPTEADLRGLGLQPVSLRCRLHP